MENAYWMGYEQADEENPTCPFDEGSIEWDSFWDGFEDGQ